MIQRQYKIVSPEGLHARPAAQLVKTLSACPFPVQLFCHGKVVNAKSILQVLTVGAGSGDVLALHYDTGELDRVLLLEQELQELLTVDGEQE
ncbi:MAG: HPr family phosphocarrier protein [Firmicutes bacterium]|jgi:phosphocarrier protein|uniref:Phosphocarrier protein HPr n=1 Tax=Sulfobacillus benefaciens TaxID=453960 RepID=A0A2T2X4A2_9FIRM|nr:HPr family phosphocarrier protein [Bacillota bacterium]MCL5013961.1 HPr family phosphocarrier protein [Bacillota bacterium]PSR29324.1 MAG: phosphocarrier protein HPr [Sulfobacillus benefaciens]